MSMYPSSPPTEPPTGPPTAPVGAPPPSVSPPPPARPRAVQAGGSGRTVIAIIMLFLAGVSASMGVAAFWTQHEILDENTWVATSRALVNNPQLQDDVATSISNQIVDAVGVENFVQNTLPSPFNRLSGTIADKATELLTVATTQVVKTDAFLSVWESAVRAVHDEFVHDVDGSSSFTSIGSQGIYLEVGPALTQIEQQLSKMGVPLLDKVDLSKIDVRILLVDAPGLERIRTWVRVLRVAVIVLPAFALIAGLVGLLIARRRSLAIIAAGVGGLVGAATAAAIAAAGKSNAIDRISGGVLGRGSATIIVDQVASGLDHALVLAVVVSGVLIVVGVIAAVAYGRRSDGDVVDGGPVDPTGSAA